MKSEKYEVIFDLKMKQTLSLAVRMVDDFTGAEPFGNLRVQVLDREYKMVEKNGGYYLFFEIPQGDYTMQVEPVYYFAVQKDGNISGGDPLGNVEDIRLVPKPGYPFPGGATLVRGTVRNSQGDFVPGAVVEIIDFKKTVESETTENGEFVLYFPVLSEDDILFDEGRAYVEGDGGKVLHLKASKDSEESTIALEAGVEEGSTTTVSAPLIL